MNRRDWVIGRLHIIKRSYNDREYGWLLWGRTFDVFMHRTLWTFRWVP